MKKKFSSTRASARIPRDVWSAEGTRLKKREYKRNKKRERKKGRKRREERETIWTEWSESVLRDTLEGVDASPLFNRSPRALLFTGWKEYSRLNTIPMSREYLRASCVRFLSKLWIKRERLSTSNFALSDPLNNFL